MNQVYPSTPAAGGFRLPGWLGFSQTTSAKHRLAAVDGLRGVAVALVLLYHGGYTWFGWSGVWLFFVLSGFFIFRNLIRARERGGFTSLRPYYLDFIDKRFRRIVPLYYLCLLIGAVVLVYLQDWQRLFHVWPFLILFVENISRLVSNVSSANLFYGHFWSVSVEVQFYVLAPFAAWYLSRRNLAVLLVATVLLMPFVRYLTTSDIALDPSFSTEQRGQIIYFTSALHFDAFALGGLVALFERDVTYLGGRRTTLLTLAAAILLCVFGAYVYAHSGARPFQLLMLNQLQSSLGYTLIITGSAAILCVALNRLSKIGMLLSFAPLRHLGVISYGVYLLHGAVFSLLHDLRLHLYPASSARSVVGLGFFAASVTVTIIVAVISYRYFEARFLRSHSSMPARP